MSSKHISSNSEYIDFAIKLAKKAGKIQMSYFGKLKSIQSKSTNIDLLSNADIESERYIVSEIKNKYPTHSIITEESSNIIQSSDYKWIIDPLDGTTNFVHSLPIFAVSIALMKNNKTICGVVYNPAADKCFHALKDNGAFLNNDSISTTSCNTLSDSLLVTGFPYTHDIKYNMLFTIFKDFYDSTRGVRRLGAAALDLCFVAMGRFDGFYEYGLNSWDICAGSLIVQEAGGIVCDWDGNKVNYNGTRILASNKNINNEMIEVLTKEEYSLFF